VSGGNIIDGVAKPDRSEGRYRHSIVTSNTVRPKLRDLICRRHALAVLLDGIYDLHIRTYYPRTRPLPDRRREDRNCSVARREFAAKTLSYQIHLLLSAVVQLGTSHHLHQPTLIYRYELRPQVTTCRSHYPSVSRLYYDSFCLQKLLCAMNLLSHDLILCSSRASSLPGPFT
jgi:hypothetical protein